MFNLINELIENKVDDANLDFYTVIIGSQPSKGARSPILWNKVYKYENKKIKMVPLDVEYSNLEILFQTLKEDHNCLGGAIAVPYKEKIFNLISENCSEETIRIGAINCFYRSNAISNDDFWGTNTDGEAAIEPIKSFLMESKKLEIGIA